MLKYYIKYGVVFVKQAIRHYILNTALLTACAGKGRMI